MINHLYLIENLSFYATVHEMHWERVNFSMRVTIEYQNLFGTEYEAEMREKEISTKSELFLSYNSINEAKYQELLKLDKRSITEDLFNYTFKIVSIGNKKSCPLKATLQEDGSYIVEFNILNVQDGSYLKDGNWRFEIDNGLYSFRPIHTPDLGMKFDDISRVFRNNGDKYLFVVVPSANLKNFFFEVRRFKAKMSKKMKKRITGYRLYNFFGNIMKLFVRRKDNAILFASDSRDHLSGNLEVIYNKMVERGLDKQYEIQFSFHENIRFRRPLRQKIALCYKLLHCKKMFIDDAFPLLVGMNFIDDLSIIQTWHANGAFKTVGCSRFGKPGGSSLDYNFHSVYDWAIVSSDNLAPYYSEAFNIPQTKIVNTGIPRVDEFLDKKKIEIAKESFYNDFPQIKGKKLILFAPTFRGVGPSVAYYPYSLIDFEKLYEACGDEYVVGFKMHFLVKKAITIPEEYSDKFFDVASYREINDIMHCADLLITDYSSVVYEASLVNIPMLFYAFDYKEYISSRGFYQGFEDFAPGKICLDFDELVTAIKNKDYEFHKVKEFADKNFSVVDGHATDRVIDTFILNDGPKLD